MLSQKNALPKKRKDRYCRVLRSFEIKCCEGLEGGAPTRDSTSRSERRSLGEVGRHEARPRPARRVLIQRTAGPFRPNAGTALQNPEGARQVHAPSWCRVHYINGRRERTAIGDARRSISSSIASADSQPARPPLVPAFVWRGLDLVCRSPRRGGSRRYKSSRNLLLLKTLYSLS